MKIIGDWLRLGNQLSGIQLLVFVVDSIYDIVAVSEISVISAVLYFNNNYLRFE